MKTTSIPRLIENGSKLIESLRQINPDMVVRGETQQTMNDKLERYHTINTQLAGFAAQSTILMNERAGLVKYFRNLPVSAREVVAGVYSKDSNEYEMVGGTRKSEIVRTNGRGVKAAKAAAAVAIAAAASNGSSGA